MTSFKNIDTLTACEIYLPNMPCGLLGIQKGFSFFVDLNDSACNVLVTNKSPRDELVIFQ